MEVFKVMGVPVPQIIQVLGYELIINELLPMVWGTHNLGTPHIEEMVISLGETHKELWF